MELYKTIADYYDQIFPFNPAQKEFVSRYLVPGITSQRILDLGCATGKLVRSLAADGWQAEGIDADPVMIEKARESLPEGLPAHFSQLDMMKIDQEFSNHSFQAVVCFGNTLAHLKNSEQIEKLFKKIYQLLENEGVLLIQVVNYDHVYNNQVTELPELDREQVRFKRSYQLKEQKVIFSIQLELKERQQLLSDAIELYPVRREEIEELLKTAGFRNLQFFENYNGDPYQAQGMALIASAKK